MLAEKSALRGADGEGIVGEQRELDVDVGSARVASSTKGTSLFRFAWVVLGFLSFGLALVGMALPVLPTTPFALLAAICFARGSKRLNAWFRSTKLYEKVLEGYITKRSMTAKMKLSILIPVTVLLGIGFLLMADVLVGRVAVALVWLGHIIYFGFVVKTGGEESRKRGGSGGSVKSCLDDAE